MLFRIVCVLILLASGYGFYELWRQYDFFQKIHTPIGNFAIKNEDTSGVVIVDFVNYKCLECRTTSVLLKKYADENKDVKLVVRPVPFTGEGVEYAVRIVLASGLQGKFWEMHDSIINYANETDEAFFKETAALYDLDYDRLIKDAKSEEVLNIMESNAGAAISVGLRSTPAVMVGKSFYEPQGALIEQDLIRMIRFEQTGLE